MAGSVTGIDISDDHLTAVQVQRGMGGWEITACARFPLPRSSQEDDEDALDQALSSLSQSMNPQGGECIVTLSGSETYYRNLTVPFKDRRKQREIISFELEPNIPFPVDDLIIDFLPITGLEETELVTFFAEKRIIGQRLSLFEAHGINPEAICVRLIPLALRLLSVNETPKNGLLLELGEKRVTLLIWQRKQVAFIRTFACGNRTDDRSESGPPMDEGPLDFPALLNSVRQTVHGFGAERKDFEPPEAVFLTGRRASLSAAPELVTEYLKIPARGVDLLTDNRIRMGDLAKTDWEGPAMEGALSLALGWYSARGLGPNFRKDEFQIEKRSFFRSKFFKKAVAWLLVIAALWAADMGVDIYFLKQRAAALDERILLLFKKGFPHITRIVDPVKQARIEINQLKRSATPGQVADPNGKTLDLLLEISERLPEAMDLTVSRLVIDPAAIRIKGNTDTYNTVDRVKQGLEKSSLFKTTTISSANLDRGNNRVLFEIKLER